MTGAGKVVITAALTGGVHDKSANPNLPEQPDEIIAQGIAAAEAGAAILHCHARTPDGRPTADLSIFRTIIEGLRRATKAIVQLSTGAGLGVPVDERFGVISLEPEMASLNMGLLNFVFGGREHFFSNMRSEIRAFAEEMRRQSVKPELEVYGFAMLEEVKVAFGEGLLDLPLVINFVLDTPTQGGVRGTPENIVELTRRARELFGREEPPPRINVTSCGTSQLPITTMALAMGLNVRVGMEDNVHFRRGELVRDNAQLVARTARIARELDREPATPEETRELLGLARSPAAVGSA